jgi:translocation and assembly module TamA
VLALLTVASPARALQLEVRVEGLDGQLQENVLALLAIYQERKDEDLTPERVEALHRRAPDQIREALAPFGHYRVEVEESLTPAAAPGGTWVARYRVEPGPPIKVGRVEYRITGPGADDPAFPDRFSMQPGDVLLHDRYSKARDGIRGIAAAQGYLDYQLVGHQVLIDPEAYEALIDFHLETGERYYLGDVRFNQDLLDEAFLQRFVRFEPGVPYDPDRLLRLQGRLLGTEYFERVEIVPHKDEAGEDRVVPIEVVAIRNKANKYRLGLGYGTDTGPRVTLEWRRRYLTRYGHKLKTELSWSPAIQRLEADYRIPIGNPVRDYVTIRPELASYDTDSRKGDTATVQFAHSVVTDDGWRRTAGVDYRYEEYEVIEDDQEVANELVPNISWAKTVTDDPIYATDGYRLKYTLLGTLDGVLGTSSYLSGTVKFKWVKSFGGDYRFITRTDLGATWAESVLDMPGSRRFFAGGDTSIRGWDYDVLGPEDPETGDTVGGRYLAVGSLELERRIVGDWSAAVFTDFGNAFDPEFDNELQVGAGIGVRWRSPVGQIRVDVAFALTRDGVPARLHLVIGPDL